MAFLNDTFTDTDSTIITSHTGETGATWVRQFGHTGDSYIQGNRLAYGSGVAVHRSSGTPGSADYSVFGWLYVASTVSGAASGVTARAQSGAGTYYYGGYVQSAGGWRLYKYVALSSTQLGSTAAQTLTVGETYLIELRVAGDQISLYVDGTLKVGPVTDTAITTAGYAGARLYLGSASTGYHLDRITDDNGGGGGTTLTLSDSSIAHTSANIALIQQHLLSIQGGAHNSLANNIDLVYNILLEIDSSINNISSSIINLIYNYILSINNNNITTTSSNIILDTILNLVISNSTHNSSAGNIVLSQVHNLLISNTQHLTSDDFSQLLGEILLAIQNGDITVSSATISLLEDVFIQQFYAQTQADRKSKYNKRKSNKYRYVSESRNK